jgi:hypothetical protein
LRVSKASFRKGSISLVAIVVLVVSLTFLILSLNPLFTSQSVSWNPFSSNGSASTSSSTTSTGGGNATNYWYVGASSSDSSAELNQGIRSLIQVRNQSISDGVLSFWVSEAFSDNLWAQIGYYIQNNSGTIAFYQIWNLTSRTEVVTGTHSVDSGVHLFSIQLGATKTGIWNFSLDGVPFGSFNMRANVSSSNYPMYAMSEEGYAKNPFGFSEVMFESAIQVYKNGLWEPVLHASSYGNNWGIEGQEQNSLLDPNQILVGQGIKLLSVDSSLWAQ